jgi:hypothetical protein
VRLCFHESGHAVIGAVFGGELRQAVVGGGRVTGLSGVTNFDDMAIARHPTTALAGPWAEARWLAGGRPSPRDLDAVLAAGGRKDRDALTAAGAAVPDVVGELSGLGERCWPAVVKVAKRLYRDGEVFHEQVCDALSIPETGNAHHRSLIWAGAVPGSFTVTPAAV